MLSNELKAHFNVQVLVYTNNLICKSHLLLAKKGFTWQEKLEMGPISPRGQKTQKAIFYLRGMIIYENKYFKNLVEIFSIRFFYSKGPNFPFFYS